MSGDTFDWHCVRGRVGVAGIYCVEARDAAEYLITHRAVCLLKMKNNLQQDVNSVEIEKL